MAKSVRTEIAEWLHRWNATDFPYGGADNLLLALRSAGFMVVPENCPDCGRWLSLYCSVDGAFDYDPDGSSGSENGGTE